jgi:hypothetical protein
MVAMKQRERDGKGPGTRYTLQRHHPVTSFLQPGPTSLFLPLPIMPPNYDSINGLIHSLGQNHFSMIGLRSAFEWVSFWGNISYLNYNRHLLFFLLSFLRAIFAPYDHNLKKIFVI